MAKQQDRSVHIRVGEGEFRENGRSTGITGAAAAGGGGAATSSGNARINQIAPTQAETTTEVPKPAAGNLTGRISKLLFFTHLLALSILVIFLSLRGFLTRNTGFRPVHWHLPLLSAAASSAVSAAAWLLLTLHRPSTALKASLFLSPLLTFSAGFLLLAAGTGGGLAFAVPALALALVQSLYACWITPRLPHAAQILSASILAARSSSSAITAHIAAALAAGVAYSWFWTLGVGGIAAHPPRLAALYVLVLLLSLSWTTHVLRNLLHVAISYIAHARLARGADADVGEAFRVASTRSLGSVCAGSAVAPLVAVVRGAARAMELVAGESDEFLFSCASCMTGVSDRLVASGNRWGFVHVGVYGKGFASASEDTWEMFGRRGMGRLIDVDLTGSFCFLCGVAGGAVAALVGGSWALAVEERYVTAVTVYAFIVGYFISRIAMSWPQACVSAYHVAYAEDPQNPRLDSTIPDRIRELQSSPD